MFQKNPFARRTIRVKTTSYYIVIATLSDMGFAGTDDLKEPSFENIAKEIRARLYNDQRNRMVFLVGA
ncbi:MAG: hypothetical protein ACP5C4_02545, partial [Methanomicrobiales archaeon]